MGLPGPQALGVRGRARAAGALVPDRPARRLQTGRQPSHAAPASAEDGAPNDQHLARGSLRRLLPVVRGFAVPGPAQARGGPEPRGRAGKARAEHRRRLPLHQRPEDRGLHGLRRRRAGHGAHASSIPGQDSAPRLPSQGLREDSERDARPGGADHEAAGDGEARAGGRAQGLQKGQGRRQGRKEEKEEVLEPTSLELRWWYRIAALAKRAIFGFQYPKKTGNLGVLPYWSPVYFLIANNY
mmetsp:Transcript_59808/g.135320  ORF Transcript_59808/g.135320 Transcript_59808/m.135320 type:complete len:241 (-) Transcript_59808:53-775(-)